jgi:hypothetical protein
MNQNSIITLTFGDQAENHAGMQCLGELVDVGQGFQRDDLECIRTKFEAKGATCEFILLNMDDLEQYDTAVVLVIRNGLRYILPAEYNIEDMYWEQARLQHDKHAWMRGQVKNKNARWNLCLDEEAQEPNYEEKKGRIVPFCEVPITQSAIHAIPHYFGEKANGLKCEGNYYYDRNKCGIGFHGDAERRKVIGMRLGAVGGEESSPLHFQWFLQSKPIGERYVIPLNAGDIYVMGEKAVGTDWMKKKTPTLRHATGCKKYTTILDKKK